MITDELIARSLTIASYCHLSWMESAACGKASPHCKQVAGYVIQKAIGSVWYELAN